MIPIYKKKVKVVFNVFTAVLGLAMWELGFVIVVYLAYRLLFAPWGG
jgi:hypothetical protein